MNDVPIANAYLMRNDIGKIKEGDILNIKGLGRLEVNSTVNYTNDINFLKIGKVRIYVTKKSRYLSPFDKWIWGVRL